jgi:hypothetical protein
MNLYCVTYKHYTGESNTKTAQIVARTIEGAVEGVRFVERQRHGYDSQEILSVEKVQGIDRVQK